MPPMNTNDPYYVSVWNATRKAEYALLSAEEKEYWSEKAVRWNEDGPDPDYKPEYVHRRKPSSGFAFLTELDLSSGWRARGRGS